MSVLAQTAAQVIELATEATDTAASDKATAGASSAGFAYGLAAIGPGLTVQSFSAVTGDGLDQARRVVARWLDGASEAPAPV